MWRYFALFSAAYVFHAVPGERSGPEPARAVRVGLQVGNLSRHEPALCPCFPSPAVAEHVPSHDSLWLAPDALEVRLKLPGYAHKNCGEDVRFVEV